MRAYVRLFCVSLGCFLFLNGSAPSQTSVPAVCKDMKTQREMNECLASAYGDADRDLYALYASVKAKLDPGAIEKLQVAERAWIRYRDSDCEAEAGLYEGGSIQPAVRSGCLERVTRARIAELHVIYDTGTR